MSDIDILKQTLENGTFNTLPDSVKQKLMAGLGTQPSMLDKARQFVTGEGEKEFDYPDFDPRYLHPDFDPSKAHIPADPRQLFYNSAVDDAARQDILKNYRPDIASTVKQDKFQVPYVTIGDKSYYLNQPGASMQDARELGAMALSMAGPTKVAQKALTAGSILGRGTAAAGVGGVGSIVQDRIAQAGGSKQGLSASRAGMNALLSGATMFAWPVVRALGVKPFQMVFGKPSLINGEFTTEAIEAFRKAGIDPSVFSAAEKKEIARLMKEATDPSALAAAEEALRLEPPVRLTKGQATGDRAQQAVEYQAREGLLGEAARERMSAFDTGARSATAQNIQGMRQGIIGDTPPNEYNVGVGQAQLQLGQERIAARAKYRQLYDDVDNFSDDALAWIETPERFRQHLLNDPDVTANLDLMPSLKKTLEDYEQKVMKLESGPAGAAGTTGSKAPSVNDMFEWRKRLNSRINGATPNEQRILIGVKKEFDKFIKDTVADGLVRGDPQLIDLWTKANTARAEYGRLFEGDDIIDRLTVLTKDGAELAVDPHQAANLIFGASDLGFVSKWNVVKNMQTLKGRLNPESWNALRGDVLLRTLGLTREQLDNIAAGSAQLPSGQVFKTSMEKFRTKNKALYDLMFSDEEDRLIKKVADVWQRVTVPKQGAANPSGSGLWMMQGLQRMVKGPTVGMFRELLALASPATRLIIKPVKGAFKAGQATGYGEGYYPPTKMLAPPPPAVSPVLGGSEEKLLRRYEDFE